MLCLRCTSSLLFSLRLGSRWPGRPGRRSPAAALGRRRSRRPRSCSPPPRRPQRAPGRWAPRSESLRRTPLNPIHLLLDLCIYRYRIQYIITPTSTPNSRLYSRTYLVLVLAKCHRSAMPLWFHLAFQSQWRRHARLVSIGAGIRS